MVYNHVWVSESEANREPGCSDQRKFPARGRVSFKPRGDATHCPPPCPRSTTSSALLTALSLPYPSSPSIFRLCGATRCVERWSVHHLDHRSWADRCVALFGTGSVGHVGYYCVGVTFVDDSGPRTIYITAVYAILSYRHN